MCKRWCLEFLWVSLLSTIGQTVCFIDIQSHAIPAATISYLLPEDSGPAHYSKLIMNYIISTDEYMVLLCYLKLKHQAKNKTYASIHYMALYELLLESPDAFKLVLLCSC